MTLNTAVFAPIAIARVRTVTTANDGARRSCLKAYAKSCLISSHQSRRFIPTSLLVPSSRQSALSRSTSPNLRMASRRA